MRFPQRSLPFLGLEGRLPVERFVATGKPD
jgi:hypothetical protein